MFLDKFLIFNLDAGTDPVSFLLEKKKKKDTTEWTYFDLSAHVNKRTRLFEVVSKSTSTFSSLLIKKKKKNLAFRKRPITLIKLGDLEPQNFPSHRF